MAKPNSKKNQAKERARQQQTVNEVRNQIEIQHDIGKDYLSPYHGPIRPDAADNIINQHLTNNTNTGYDLNSLDYSLDNSTLKTSHAEVEYDYNQKQQAITNQQAVIDRADSQSMYEGMIDQDTRNINVMHDEAINMNTDIDTRRLAQQVIDDSDSRINGAIGDIIDSGASREQAQARLNSLMREGYFDSTEELAKAKAKFSSHYGDVVESMPSRLHRPDIVEGVERLKGRDINFNTTKNAYAIKTNSNGKVVGSVANSPGARVVNEGAEGVGNQYLKKALSGRSINALVNLGFAVTDYNESRNAGEGVAKSFAKAGTQFVAGEMLGGYMLPVMLAKQLPSLAVNTIETTQNITRKMNSTSRIQTFGEARFQDSQQLATMRQAGMEMAKMSQYNLQQSMMGNEAQYMHRL